MGMFCLRQKILNVPWDIIHLSTSYLQRGITGIPVVVTGLPTKKNMHTGTHTDTRGTSLLAQQEHLLFF